MEIRPLSTAVNSQIPQVQELQKMAGQPDSVVLNGQPAKAQKPFSSDMIARTVGASSDPYLSDLDSWNPEVEKRIDSFLSRVKAGEIENPTAVFDADGTLWRDDIGERFLQWLIKNRHLQGADYSKDIYGEYEKLLEKDTGAAYAMATKLMSGINEKELAGWAADFFPSHFSSNVFPKQRELISRLQEAGVDVWIVSASNRWIVEGASPHMGVPQDHVVGIQTEVKNGVLTDRIIPPVTYRQGKVDAIREYIGEKVDFAAGNSMTDFEMLGFAKDTSLVINPKDSGAPDNNLMSLAQKGDWAIQKWN
jgi:HAD superfamily phosphoserine phosphatase-like hydrolase